jgi:siroheme synthase-like protein
MTPAYPVFLRLENEPVLVVGGDDEAADRCGRLVACGARVTAVWPEATRRLRTLALRREVHWYARAFTPGDARGCRIVLLTARDPGLAARLRNQGRRDGFWLCAIDQPAFCDFAHGGVVQAGPVQIAVSTGGTAPAFARVIRDELARALDPRFERFSEQIAAIRAEGGEMGREAQRERLGRALAGFALDVSVRYPSWESEPGGRPV